MDQKKKSKVGAILKGIALGKIIQKDFPQVSELYKKNFSILRIVKYLKLADVYSQKTNICESGVYWALRGYNNSLKIFDRKDLEYPGLLPMQDIRNISQKNKSYSMKVVGNKAYQNKTGIFALSKEEVSKNTKKGAVASGRTLYSSDEIIYLKKLISMPEYRYYTGRHCGSLRLSEIAREINNKKHKGKLIRNARSLSQEIKRKKLHQAPQLPMVYSTLEVAYIAELMDLPENIYSEGRYVGKINTLLICQKINMKFHEGKPFRSVSGIDKKIRRIQEKLNKKKDLVKVFFDVFNKSF